MNSALIFTAVSFVCRVKCMDHVIEKICCSFLMPLYPQRKTHISNIIEKNYRIELIQAFCSLHEYEFGWKDITQAIEITTMRGNIHVLSWLLENLVFSKGYAHLSIPIINVAASVGRLDVLNWLERKPFAYGTFDAFDLAARGGYLNVIKWLYVRRCHLCHQGLKGQVKMSNMMSSAAICGQLEIIQWAFEQRRWTPQSLTQVFQDAARNGHLHIINWLHRKLPGVESYNILTMYDAAKEGHLQAMEWLWKHGKLTPPKCNKSLEPSVAAASNGHLDVVKWLHSMNLLDSINPMWSFSVRAVDTASNHGHFEVVQWLLENRSERCSFRAICDIAAHGHFDMVIWLHRHPTTTNFFCSSVMDNAASSGHLEMVQWLHENRPEGCISKAMDFAAKGGHLRVLQWLHSNEHEGCTSDAMDDAGGGGHLDVIKWLHQHRKEGCTSNAMDYAAINGHLDVVQWLHEHRNEGCTTKAIDFAAYNGHRHVVKWLQENRNEGCSQDAIRLAVVQGHLDIVQLLCETNKLLPFNYSYFIRSAILQGHLEIAKWLKENRQIIIQKDAPHRNVYHSSLADAFFWVTLYDDDVEMVRWLAEEKNETWSILKDKERLCQECSPLKRFFFSGQ